MITLVDISRAELHNLCSTDNEHDVIDGLNDEQIAALKDNVEWGSSGIDSLKFVVYMMCEKGYGFEHSSHVVTKNTEPRFPLVEFEESELRELARDFGWKDEEFQDFLQTQNIAIKDGDDTQEDLWHYFFGEEK